MCGVAGLISRDEISPSLATSLCDSLSHRGPDDRGTFSTSMGSFNVLLAQTRLSIIDVSSAGHQPFSSPDGRFQLVYNGEIFNYLELREMLIEEGVRFETNTDTEVLLHSWIAWGEMGLTKLDGMFAFAVLDTALGSVTLVRDAFGIKPLYYSFDEDFLAFSSTPEALVSTGLVTPDANLQACFNYLAWGQYDQGEHTFFRNIKRLESGSIIRFDLTAKNTGVELKRWWNPDFSIAREISYEDAVTETQRLFLQSVSRQMRSDVAIGFALSGGIDSSAIVCAARYLNPEIELMSFSYLSSDPAISEESWVRLANRFAQSELNVVSFGVDAVDAQIEEMQAAQGEPFSSSRIFAQYKVFEAARKRGVKVVLEGQGGDELFAGYLGFAHLRLISLMEQRRFLELFRYIVQWSRWPGHNIRALIGQSLSYLMGLNKLPAALQSIGRNLLLGESLNRVINFKPLAEVESMSAHLHRLRPEYRGRRVIEGLLDALRDSFIPQLVRQGDRNAMAHSVENRVPFLSLPLVEFVLSLPEDYLVASNGQTKRLLRDAMRGIVPDDVLDRKDKVGFETPQHRLWRSVSLREASHLVSELIPFAKDVDPEAVRGHALVWRYLNLGLWLEMFINSKSGKR